MRPLILAVAAILGPALSTAAHADPLPIYTNIGSIAATETFTAMQTGAVSGYFVRGGALSGGGELYTDYMKLIDVTSGISSGLLFNSQTAHTGDSSVLGTVHAGDMLVFEIYVQNLNETFASSPAFSSDGYNHVYGAAYGGGTFNGTALPSGLYLGMEDTNIKTNQHAGNLDYQDISVIATNVSASTSPVPEPGSLMLLGSGVLAAAAAARRRLTV